MTTRRSFLALLGSTLTWDPERLLWAPGSKLISIPSTRILEPKLSPEETTRILFAALEVLRPAMVSFLTRPSMLSARKF